jgi:hypothetical protein
MDARMTATPVRTNGHQSAQSIRAHARRRMQSNFAGR